MTASRVAGAPRALRCSFRDRRLRAGYGAYRRALRWVQAVAIAVAYGQVQEIFSRRCRPLCVSRATVTRFCSAEFWARRARTRSASRARSRSQVSRVTAIRAAPVLLQNLASAVDLQLRGR
jgi:hypothetical protein